jgi:hypothetical protein
MSGTCLRPWSSAFPTTGIKVPSGPDWLSEIKYDGCWLARETAIASG